jgi:hypothetical protein
MIKTIKKFYKDKTPMYEYSYDTKDGLIVGQVNVFDWNGKKLLSGKIVKKNKIPRKEVKKEMSFEWMIFRNHWPFCVAYDHLYLKQEEFEDMLEERRIGKDLRKEIKAIRKEMIAGQIRGVFTRKDHVFMQKDLLENLFPGNNKVDIGYFYRHSI